VFQGYFKLALDPKGRISMPTRYRDQLMESCAGRLTLTRHPDGCLLVYPRPRWEAKREEVDQLPYEARVLRRLLLGAAADVELDSAARLLIPSSLREVARLSNDATLMGAGAHLELWDPEVLRACEENPNLPGLPPAAAGFRF
jgi:MraZ protein